MGHSGDKRPGGLLGEAEQLRRQIGSLESSPARQLEREAGLIDIVNSLLNLTQDPPENINRLLRVAGTFTGASCGIYTRLDQGRLRVCTRWNVSEEDMSFRALQEHACRKLLALFDGESVVTCDLQNHEFSSGAPGEGSKHLRTGFGLAVKLEDTTAGALCLFYESRVDLSEKDWFLLELVGSAIAAEEKRKQSLDLQQQSEVGFRAVFETSSDAIFIKDRNFRYILANPSATKLFLKPVSELLGKTDLELFGPKLASETRATDVRVLEGEIVEHERDRPDAGSDAIFHVIKAPIRDSSGEIVGLYGIARDITVHKKTEEALRRSETMLSKILSSSPAAISYVEQGKLLWTNPAMVDMFGYESQDDYLGMDVPLFYSSRQEYKRVVRLFFQSLKRGESAETVAEFRRRDGSVFFGRIKITALDSTDPGRGAIATVSDISVSKKAEEELRASEERYRLLAQNSLTGIYIHQDGRFVYVNDRMAAILGYDRDQVMGRPFWEFVHPDDREFVRHVHTTGSGPQEAPSSFVIRVLCRSGEEKHVEVLASHIVHEGRPANMGNLADITERKRAEQALRESQDRYRTLVEESFDGIFVQKAAKIVFANSRLCEMLGYDKGELEGKDHWVVYHPSYQELTRERAQARMRGEYVPSRYEVKLLRKDGTSFDGEISARAIRFGTEPGIQVWVRDITERKRAAENLLRIEKLESTGILAGGIAHDFNNILTGILGNISLAKLYAGSGDKVSERLAGAEKALRRARGLTQQLLAFAKGGTPIKRVLSIADLVRDSCEFALGGSNVRCEFFIEKNLWPVEVDAGQISQVVNNLVINADQAMPDGGIIRVYCENKIVTHEDGLPLEHGQYVKISIRDYGIGIQPEHLPKVFDPYFTTKDRGSGLGLATAFAVVKNHRGFITVDSEPRKGATFAVYLPASPKPQRRLEVSEGQLLRGTGKVLLMDDEDSIREVAGELLHMLGYEVHFARDGVEAINLYAQALNSEAPFDAVIMDLTVPGGVGGKEAIEKLRSMDPNIKAIVSSGYSDDPVMANFADYGFGGVVAKPYSAQEISMALRKLLDAEPNLPS